MRLQKEEGAVIGLGIHLPDDNSGVSVKFVQEGGLAAAFNEKNPDLALKTGDKIVAVNEATEQMAIATQLKESQTLKMTLERPSVDLIFLDQPSETRVIK